MPNDQPLTSEERDFVLRVLRQFAQPVPRTKLENGVPKAGPVPPKRLPEVLEQLVQAGQVRIHRARTILYWLPELEEAAAARILEALTERPLTPKEFEGKYPSLLPGWPKARRKELIDRLIKEKRIHKVAHLAGAGKLFSAHPQLTPEHCVKLALQLAIAKLKPKGLTADQVYALVQELLPVGALPAVPRLSTPVALNPEETLKARMLQLKPAAANGALVSLSDLRRSLSTEFPGKAVFDQAILQLAATDRFALHHHDFPSSLSQEEREALVLDEFGNYYIGIALRV